MPFDRQHRFTCKICDYDKFEITQGHTGIFLKCPRCESTDEIDRRRLGYDL